MTLVAHVREKKPGEKLLLIRDWRAFVKTVFNLQVA
jgi:hypothetical protein